MEIIVESNVTKSFKADEVSMIINFVVIAKTYEEALEKGNYSVQMFINELNKMGFTSGDLQTGSFIIRQERKYNTELDNYDFIGYSYNQNASLKFDYDSAIISKIMASMINLDNAPTYEFVFGLKDEMKYKNLILDEAYHDSLKQAEAISEKFNKTLKDSLKADFRFYNNQARLSATSNNYGDVINPSDISISAVLYVTWLAQ